MTTLQTAAETKRVRSALTALVIAVAAVAIGAAITNSPSRAAPRVVSEPITLTFAGEVVGEDGLADFVAPYPPIEGGAALEYTVPTGYRLVIDSLYADVAEAWVPNVTYQRGFVTAGISTAYFLGEQCPYPGWQRSYDVPLTTNVSQVYGTDEGQARRAGSLSGPIFVEGGRRVGGTAWAPGGDSTLYVHLVAHGRLEAATGNPIPPTCGL